MAQVVFESPVINSPSWVPAVNGHGGFGRRAFVEIADPWDPQNMIRAHVRARSRRQDDMGSGRKEGHGL